jgi:hypothetical protein
LPRAPIKRVCWASFDAKFTLTTYTCKFVYVNFAFFEEFFYPCGFKELLSALTPFFFVPLAFAFFVHQIEDRGRFGRHVKTTYCW